MADQPTPLTIRAVPPKQQDGGELDLPGDLAAPLGRGVAQTLRYLIAVLDREDRLESGTGEWLADFRAEGAGNDAVTEGVLRAMAMAADRTNFAILEALSASGSVATTDLAQAAGLGELPIKQRVGDLVSAGLAAKQPETNQVAATAAGNALVELVHQAGSAGTKALEEELS